ncbi:putative monooxygenase [Tothia fuscella]|uniref:Monooxygenase n=1 Tax=Tothia fuscella TaxID=1048955 RepID=A0A9P4P3G3_9PEZI|nr:putative monooxygenase [Tothia fuscella]
MAAKAREQLGFDPDAIEEKYRIEKDKRMRKDGDRQYQAIEGAFEHLKLDAFAGKSFTRAPIITNVGAVIVGGGYGGILCAVRLVQKGFTDFVIVEKGGDIGGTWYWNQYPGARCDVESYIYMPLLEELGFMPSEKYARGSEIKKHFAVIAEKYGLKDKTIFQTEVTEMVWDNKGGRWDVSTDRNDHIKSKYTITAAGILHVPKLPGIPGITAFKGHAFHTTRWDYDYTGGREGEVLSGLKDKRVAIIGTGATSIQVVPCVAQYAKHLYTFQRTPAAVNVRDNRPTDPNFASSLKPGWQQHRMDNFNAILAGLPVEEDLVNDGWTANNSFALLGSGDEEMNIEEKMRLADMQKMQRVRARVDEIVKDKSTAEALKPWYGSICKRPCFHDEYLDAFNRPNCTLVDTNGKGLERITEKGVVANGKEYEVDLIIYSTGFVSPANAWNHTGMSTKGRDGQLLSGLWKQNGVVSLFGSQTRGFPNYFNVGVLQAGVSGNFVYTLDVHSKQIAYVIVECEKRGVKSIEPEPQAQQAWVEGIVEGSKAMRSYFINCTPSYFNNEGHLSDDSSSSAIYAGGATAWAKLLEDWRAQGDMKGLELTNGSSISAKL